MKHLLFFCLLLSINVNSQQEPISGMYWNNYSYFNPAMSGVDYQHEANGTFRSQWDKVNGAPNTLFINYGFNLAEKHGLGGNYTYETIGNSRINRAKINYNYQVKLENERKLVFGTAVSFHHLRYDGVWIPPTTGDDPALPNLNQTDFSVDLGIAYYGKSITAGISATQIPTYVSSDPYTTATHLFGNLRYEFSLSSQPDFYILETKLRTDFVKYSQDFNIGFNYREIFEVGLGYRTSDAILFNLTGIIKKNYRIGYLYAMTINKLSSLSQGTHEIALGLRIPNK